MRLPCCRSVGKPPKDAPRVHPAADRHGDAIGVIAPLEVEQGREPNGVALLDTNVDAVRTDITVPRWNSQKTSSRKVRCWFYHLCKGSTRCMLRPGK